MKLATGLILSLGLSLAACGNDNDPPDVGPDAAGPPVGECMIEGNLGTIAPVGTVQAISLNDAGAIYTVEAKGMYNTAQAPALPDWFMIQLYDQTATFPGSLGNVTPGTYELGPEDLSFRTCGACLMLVGDHTGEASEEKTNTYLATSGSITINSILPTFDFTINNVNFQHVQFVNPNDITDSSPNPSGCTASVTSLSFSAEVQNLEIPEAQFIAEDSLAARRLQMRKR